MKPRPHSAVINIIAMNVRHVLIDKAKDATSDELM